MGAVIYYFVPSKEEVNTLSNQSTTGTGGQEEKIRHSSCLSDGERADYLRERDFIPSIPLTILIQDKDTKEEKFRFEISNVRPSEAYPLSNHMFKCGFYVVRRFNHNYRTELWHYNYSNDGQKMLDLFKPEDENNSFSTDFRIDKTETFVALIKSWYGEPENHALVIKDIGTMEDKFVISLKELTEKFPDVEPATISLGYWGGLFQL